MSFFPGWTNQMEAGMAAIENMWGEQADLLPWQKDEDAARFVEPGPDTTRAPLLDVRILFKRKQVSADKEGEGSVASQMIYAVIRTAYIQQIGLQQGDHVRLIDRGEMYKVSNFGQKYTTRQRVYLTELQETPT